MKVLAVFQNPLHAARNTFFGLERKQQTFSCWPHFWNSRSVTDPPRLQCVVAESKLPSAAKIHDISELWLSTDKLSASLKRKKWQ